MPNHIIKYIWLYSKKQQLVLVVLTCLSFPLLYMSLEIPKIIVNEVLSSTTRDYALLGYSVNTMTLLMLLSFGLFGLVLTNGLFKIYINVLKGKVGEGLIRRMRFMLTGKLLQLPPEKLEQIPGGEISMSIVQETDPLAGFAGDAFALPVFQGGTLITILLFMFMQDWLLGIAALALVPVQLFIIPRLQRQINLLRKERILQVRRLSSRLVETVEAMDEVRIQGTRRYTQAEFSYRFGNLYKVRLEIFKKKYFMKFLNNMIGHATPLMFYAIGGYLILKGELTIGALVAVIAAHKDFLSPWKELLNYYQNYHDSIVKYDNVLEHFFHQGLSDSVPASAIVDQQDKPAAIEEQVFDEVYQLTDVSAYNTAGDTLIQNINLSIERGQAVAIVASDSNESKVFARIMAGLRQPSQGSVSVGEVALNDIPEHMLRQNIGFVNASPYLFNATLSYNLGYGLNHVPPPIKPEHEKELKAAIQSGGSLDWFDETFDCVWTNLGRLGANNWEDALVWINEQMDVVDSSEQMVLLAFKEIFNPADYPEDVFGRFPDELVAFRTELKESLANKGYAGLVEHFDREQFNFLSSFKENLIFGSILNEKKDTQKRLRKLMISSLENNDLLDESLTIAIVVLRRFLKNSGQKNLVRDSQKQLDLLFSSKLKKLQDVLDQFDVDKVAKTGRYKKNTYQLISFFLEIVPVEWPELELHPSYVKKLINVRHQLASLLMDDPNIDYHLFAQGRYNPGLTVMSNTLFGRINEQHIDAQEIVFAEVKKLVEKRNLEAKLIQLLIVNSQAGVSGSLVPTDVRHRISLARTLMKKPTVLILHEALLPLEYESQVKIISNIRQSRPDMTLVWIGRDKLPAEDFDAVYRLDKELTPHIVQKTTKKGPKRSVSLLVSYSAGAATDFQARIVTMMAAQQNAKGEDIYLGEPMVVVNRPGRGGQVGWKDFLQHAQPDGHELAVYNIPHIFAQSIIFPDPVNDLIKDLEPIANWGADPAVFIVSKDSRFDSMADVIKFAKDHPGKLTVSGAGMYVGHHVANLQLEKSCGISTHYLSAGGGRSAINMVVEKQVMAGFNNLSDAFRYKDRIKILGVADRQRNPSFLPDVPTMLEQDMAVDNASVNYRGIMAPPGTPKTITDFLSEKCCAMFADRLVVNKMKESGAPMDIMNREAVQEMWRSHRADVRILLRDLIN